MTSKVRRWREDAQKNVSEPLADKYDHKNISYIPQRWVKYLWYSISLEPTAGVGGSFVLNLLA